MSYGLFVDFKYKLTKTFFNINFVPFYAILVIFRIKFNFLLPFLLFRYRN